jgi:phosphate-selective porin OprO/OprP
MKLRAVLPIVLVTLATTASARQSQGPDVPLSEEEKLRREVEDLRSHQRWLERRVEADEEKLARGATPSRFRFGSGGFVFGTPDHKNELRLRAVLHFDGRFYFGGNTPDTFVVRRARPIIEGTLFGAIDFRLMPNFAYGQAKLDDGYVELHPWIWLRLRAGRYRVPIGLEWIQSDCAIHLVERSLATNLVPWRDLGVMLQGDVADSTVYYAVGVFNGAPDNADGPDFASHSEKDYVGRVFVRPLARTHLATWTDLGFGVAGSYGSARGSVGATALPTYRSPGQQPIFAFVASTVMPDVTALAAGERWRVMPQAYWYIGPVGVLAEYGVSSQRVERFGMAADLQNRAWNLTAMFVLTLERASFEAVVPRRPIDFRHFALGAFELVVRYSELHIDPAAFPWFADPATSVTAARELAAGLNWYLTDFLKMMFSFHRTDFNGGASMGRDREPENALLMRLQIAL